MKVEFVACKRKSFFLISVAIFISFLCIFHNSSDLEGKAKASPWDKDFCVDSLVREQPFSSTNIGRNRQGISHKGHYETIVLQIFDILISRNILIKFLMFSCFQSENVESSHKYIMDYIHHQDGIKK